MTPETPAKKDAPPGPPPPETPKGPPPGPPPVPPAAAGLSQPHDLVAAALAMGISASKESLDAAYVYGSRRKAELQKQVDEIQRGLDRLQEVAIGQKVAGRRACFGQYDSGAPMCVESCRDPLCPDATVKMRPDRMKALQEESVRIADQMGNEDFHPVGSDGVDVSTVEPAPMVLIGPEVTIKVE